MTNPASAEAYHYYRTLMAIDTEGSTTKTNTQKANLRRVMYSILEEAMRIGGLSESDRTMIDWGDGALALIHPADRIPKTKILGVVVPALEELLDKQNNEKEPKIRLRVAVHAGEVHRDDRGWYGESLDVIFRLINSTEAKRALKNTRESSILIVSGEIQRAIIRHNYRGITSDDYFALFSVRVHDSDYQGWLRRPSLSARHQVEEGIAVDLDGHRERRVAQRNSSSAPQTSTGIGSSIATTQAGNAAVPNNDCNGGK